ncbi:MAG: leucyl-tRNA synthetase [Parcubacteria bacterium C7867-008]|nr:MAG: leucyl-tRNA synthetase [Parcubacteria bacterium C7867-008]
MAKNRFDHTEIEKKAQEKWASLDLYQTDLTDTTKDPYYLMFEFPFPSGDLHIGHWYAFALTDIFARYLRMAGKNVLFPVGFDSFGLPAENAAIKNGKPTPEWTYNAIDTMRGQMRSMGTSVDWSKEVITSDPEYYRWTQWLFLKLFEHKLAERREAPVKWCPKDATVLANEQVIDGKCERCGTDVEEKYLTQWFLKITDYAERLLTDLDPLPWREDIKESQRAWIGKSEGAKLRFQVVSTENATTPSDKPDGSTAIEVFTTRPDTIYGVTYVVLAPEHPLIDTFEPLITNGGAVAAYRQATSRKSERERSENKDKTGVQLEGVMAMNPATREEIPVYVADYVLASYGTGAVMAVPAHDERDFVFAKKFNLPIKHVIDPITGHEQTDPKHKNKIVAVVEHEGKVLTIKWPEELGGRLLVGGTAEEGEDPAVTAAREILEETGYADLELVEQAQEQVHHSYFAFSKNQATIAHTTLLHFRLRSNRMEETQLEADEIGKFTVEWVTPDVARKEIHDDQHQYTLARFTNYSAYTGNGTLSNSGSFTGRDNREAMADIIEAVGGEVRTNYRIRDWLVSRQRYWGCPIPIVYDPEGNPHAVPAEHLPWTLPTDVDSDSGKGQSPLKASKELAARVEQIFGEGWTPECDTLDVFVDSSWYFLRYLDPKDEHDFSNQSLMKKWLPVNRYSGGSEHTTVHLLYARFFYKALYDLGLVPTSEPFYERFNRGLVLDSEGRKMSKRWGNVVNPDEMVKLYGADAVRMYLAFMGPYNEAGHYPWKLTGVEAMRKFLDRIVSLSGRLSDEEPSEATLRVLAKAIDKVGTDITRFKYNTAISGLMVLVNELEALSAVPRRAYHDLISLLAPFAPHVAEYLYENALLTSSHAGAVETIEIPKSVHELEWPLVDESLLTTETIIMGVQIAGKRRGEVSLSLEATEEEAVAAALSQPDVAKFLEGGTPSRVIYVPGRILNLIP